MTSALAVLAACIKQVSLFAVTLEVVQADEDNAQTSANIWLEDPTGKLNGTGRHCVVTVHGDNAITELVAYGLDAPANETRNQLGILHYPDGSFGGPLKQLAFLVNEGHILLDPSYHALELNLRPRSTGLIDANLVAVKLVGYVSCDDLECDSTCEVCRTEPLRVCSIIGRLTYDPAQMHLTARTSEPLPAAHSPAPSRVDSSPTRVRRIARR